jgi:DNA replication protein DnaC
MGDTWVGGFESGTGWALGMVEVCSLCEGSGLRVVEEGGRQVARPCECRIQRRAARMLEQARIPKRYEHCSLDNYVSGFRGADRTLAAALIKAKGFVKAYPVETDGKGLLLVGQIGVGKTHLAVGILRLLVEERGASGLFCDYRELLKEVQNSYNPQVAATELGILRPVFDAEVLVLDELGAAKPSDWVWDTVAHILNSRYNDQRTTIITTNYPNAGALGATPRRKAGKSPEQEDAEQAMREETLGDRIGERMRSRLQEMCEVVEMRGDDFRQKVKRADFASSTKEATTSLDLQSAAEALLSAAQALQSAAEQDIPSISSAIQDGARAIQSGAAVGSMPRGTRIGERPIATPALELEDPLSGRIRPSTNLAVAIPEPRTQTEEEESPIAPQVWVNGVPEPMITRRESFPDERLQLPDEPPGGRGKRDKSVTPQPKRLDSSPRKG